MKPPVKFLCTLVCGAVCCGAIFCFGQTTGAHEGSAPNGQPAKTGETAKQVLPPEDKSSSVPASAPAAQRDPEGAPAPLPGGQPRSLDPGNNSKRYVIGPLDVLFIRVWNNANLTGTVNVRPDGMTSMPLVGELRADGLTIEQFTEALKMRLSEYFANIPEVDVQLTKVNSKKFYIYGEVLKQGEFPLVGETTVLDALSNAGGFKDFANLKKIYVLRGSQKLMFNYKDVSVGKHSEQNIKLEPGDRIFVP